MVKLPRHLTGLLAARNTVRLPKFRTGEFKVFSYDPGTNTVVVEATADTVLAAPLSLRADRGRFHAALTPLIERRGLPDDQVRRKIGRIFKGEADDLTEGWISGWCAEEPSDFGIDFEEVEVSPVSTMTRPAWLVEPPNARPGVWAIHIHGRTAARQETIRSMQACTAAGVSSLSISYRAEADARVRSSDRSSTLGLTEADDVLLAMNWLSLNKRATSFILVGWSLGAVIAAEALRRSVPDGRVIGMIFDSAVVDIQATLREQALAAVGDSRIADSAIAWMSGGGYRLTGLDKPLDVTQLGLASLDLASLPPSLFLHAEDDTYVPVEPVRALVARSSGRFTLREFAAGGHVKSWNCQPKEWTGAIRGFLAELLG